MSITKTSTFFRLTGLLKMESSECGLHPLIHTIAPKTLAQYVEKKKAEPKTPHFFSLNQDIVASPQDEKCGLKYDICILLAA